MNKKLIAAAVSAAVVAPVAAYGEVTVYGRINNAISISDIAVDDADTVGVDESDNNTDISNVSSRFGVRYNAEVGNGMTAHGQYEFATVTDKELPGINDIRVATVGLSGAFGRVDIGNQWSSYFNTFGTLVSPTYTLGFYMYSSIGGAPYRSSNTIKYSNSFGPLSAQLDVRLNDSDETNDEAEKIRGNGIGLGLSFAVSDNITIAAAFDSESGADNNETRAEVAPAARVAPMTPNALATLMWDADGGGADDDDIATAAQITAYNDIATNAANMNHAEYVADETARAAAVQDRNAEFIENLISEANDGRPTRGTADADPRYALAPLDDTDVDGYTPAVAAVNGEVAGGNDDPDTSRVGIAIKANFGGYWASLGWQNYQVDDDDNTAVDDETDIDTTFIYGGGSLGEKTSWLIGYSEADDGRDASAAVSPLADDGNGNPRYGLAGVTATDDSSQLTWGVYHNLGGGLKLYYEATDVDSENNSKDGAVHLLGMRVDF